MKKLIPGSWKKLNVTPKELRLEVTLLCGQVFHWKQVPEQKNHFIGVLETEIVELKQSEDNVFYRNFNEEKEKEISEDFFHQYFNFKISCEELHKKFSENDALFGKIAPYFPGLRVIKQDPFECLISFICSSNNNVSRITKMINSLCEKYGSPLGSYEDYNLNFHSFPTINQLSTATEEELRDLGFGYRAKYVVSTVEKLSNLSDDYFDKLRIKEKTNEILQDLTRFDGVGLKVAACVALYSLDRFDVVPLDVHMLRVAENHYINHDLSKNKDKTLMKGSLNPQKFFAILEIFTDVFGNYAGWAQMAIYSAQLKSHDHFEFPEEIRDEVMGTKKRKTEETSKKKQKK
jgi:N-glycosylase/DNA lyase